MRRAEARDRAVLHDVHGRFANLEASIDDDTLRAVLRVALAYTSPAAELHEVEREVAEEFDEDSLALVEILSTFVLRRSAAYKGSEVEEFG